MILWMVEQSLNGGLNIAGGSSLNSSLSLTVSQSSLETAMGEDEVENERVTIIARYELGRDPTAVIDPWDDPAFPIYHATDHFGFIHDQSLPSRLGPEELKRNEIETDRTDKWLKMIGIKSWPKYRNSEKLRRRVYKGIPNKIRGAAWALLLELTTLKEQQKGKYKEMLDLAKKYSTDVRQIDLDVNRTYRDNVMFRERYGTKQVSLFNVLCAYSIYNVEIGYCQGMSQVAALLLLYLDEEEAFWGLAQLMSHHKFAMHGFFIVGFPKLARFQAHHDRILGKLMPKLRRHFERQGVDSGLYTLKWFFQCFLDRVPYDLALRLWDVYLLEGELTLICGAYAILKMHQKALLARKSLEDILTYLQSRVPANFGMSHDLAIQNFQKSLEELRAKRLDRPPDPSDEELPKRPFGVIDASFLALRRPPAPSPVPKENKVALAADETLDYEEDEEETLCEGLLTATSFAPTSPASGGSSSVANFVEGGLKYPVSPRKGLLNNNSGHSAAVRIHVPYGNDGEEIRRPDPNLIKLDVQAEGRSEQHL